MTPTIVHPERNFVILNDPNKLLSLVKIGVLKHLIASDAHYTTTRRFYMKEAYQLLEKNLV